MHRSALITAAWVFLAAAGVLASPQTQSSQPPQPQPGQEQRDQAAQPGTQPSRPASTQASTAVPLLPEREELAIPTGERWLGSVRIPVAVLADGDRLPPGTYRIRLTGESAQTNVPGQLEALERWVEFVQTNKVRGRAMAPVVPASAVSEVAETRPPAKGRFRVEQLRGGDYLRVWYNFGGDQILIYLPIAASSGTGH